MPQPVCNVYPLPIWNFQLKDATATVKPYFVGVRNLRSRNLDPGKVSPLFRTEIERDLLGRIKQPTGLGFCILDKEGMIDLAFWQNSGMRLATYYYCGSFEDPRDIRSEDRTDFPKQFEPFGQRAGGFLAWTMDIFAHEARAYRRYQHSAEPNREEVYLNDRFTGLITAI